MVPLKDENGVRKVHPHVYEDDPDLELHYRLATNLINSSTCETIVLYGKHVQRFFCSEFKVDLKKGAAVKVTIAGLEVCLKHSEFHAPVWIATPAQKFNFDFDIVRI